MSHDLLPCPFCGGKAVKKFIGNEYTKKRSVEITCSTFGCTVTIKQSALYHSHEWLNEKTAARWNRRADPQKAKANQ
jgi:hypothetical protein